MIGHSEGGMIVPMVAGSRKDIDFIVLMAGPGVPIIELMAAQNEAIARSAGMTDISLKEIKPLFTKVANAINNAKDSISAITDVSVIMEDWASHSSAEALAEMDLHTKTKRDEYTVEMVKQLRSTWFRYFIRFDPTPYLQSLSCKVLAINGNKDVQVVSKQNLPGIEAALKKSKSTHYDIKEIPGVNHLFQACNKCTVAEYGELEETISPIVLELIVNWLDKNVK
jgi:pimeloyl-ACP methyl ester carboxylesterase